MIPLCELPEDWNPNKEPRAELISQGYVLFEWCRSGRSHYETWVLNAKPINKYHVVHYRWCYDAGWVPSLQSLALTSDREDLLVRTPLTSTLVITRVDQEEKEDVHN